MWTDIIESAGFYPYLEWQKECLLFKNTAGEIRKEFHWSHNLKKYFHEEQKLHSDFLQNSKRNLIVSAPTSFGKSLLIQEVVASKKYKNIIIIQPTLALLDETRKKLMEYKDIYKIIVRTTQEPSIEKGNLFLLTAERVMEYPEFPQIDFFVIDEFYKLSAERDRERFDVLNNAFNLLLTKHNSKFYLLGPNIASIPEGFEQEFNAKFLNTSYSLVDNREIDKTSDDYKERGLGKEKKEQALFELLTELRDEQTIIYCASPQSVRDLARGFYYYLKEQVESGEIKLREREKLSLIEWINENIGKEWTLSRSLQFGIGIHDAALQKHITSSIINYFNNDKLSFLFCTTTIIEGVNTSAKNVIFFDKYKGSWVPIDSFDYSNIKGRAGRMMVHFVGRIFNFNSPPQKTAVSVDMPFFDQKKISDEILINLSPTVVKNKESTQYIRLMSIPEEERELFRKNGLSVEGQKKILELLKKEVHENYDLIYWESYPKFEQLLYVLSLAWYLLKPRESRAGIYNPRQLTTVTHKYLRWRDITRMVFQTYNYYLQRKKDGVPKYADRTDEELFDDAIKDQFLILRTWFHYKVPKWLNVMNNLQEFVCLKNNLKPANYTYFSTQLENDFVEENLSILIEYGIPTSAIKKLARVLPDDYDEDNILEILKANKYLLEKANLLDYEKEKILENL